MQDYHNSRRSLSELADFKMYRLNIWQSAANPWLRMSDWHACHENFTETPLEGQVCYAGLDLARKQDLTALVLCFPDSENECTILPYFWLPEDVASDSSHPNHHFYRDWVAAGHLLTTPGNVCDYAFVEHAVATLLERFHIIKLIFDPWQAEEPN